MKVWEWIAAAQLFAWLGLGLWSGYFTHASTTPKIIGRYLDWEFLGFLISFAVIGLLAEVYVWTGRATREWNLRRDRSLQ